MGFGIQIVPNEGWRRHVLVPGVLGRADNAELTHPAGSAGLPSPGRGDPGAKPAGDDSRDTA